MELKRDQLQKDILAMYAREIEELGESGTQDHLARGAALNEKHNLGALLKERGMLVFPHISVHDCGYQQAACAARPPLTVAQAKWLLLACYTHLLKRWRMRVERLPLEPSHLTNRFMVFKGGGLNESTGRIEWTGDHALMGWRHFWEAEIKRRGITDPPQMIERYPWLAGGKPGELPGIDELAELCEDAVILSTADPVHHGIGYGTPADEAFEPDEAGIAMATDLINEGIGFMAKQEHWEYNEHTLRAKSDHRDAGQVMSYLRGPMQGEIIDNEHQRLNRAIWNPTTNLGCRTFGYLESKLKST